MILDWLAENPTVVEMILRVIWASPLILALCWMAMLLGEIKRNRTGKSTPQLILASSSLSVASFLRKLGRLLLRRNSQPPTP